ncbi:MAG: CHASE2 domain-containing protein [Candidatus Hydrogenedentota bacterium]
MQRFKALISKHKKVYERIINGFIFGLTVGILALLLDRLDLFKRTELKSLDLRYRLRPQIKICEDLGYIDYDDPSIDLFGFWPWARNRQVALIDTLKFYNSRACGYDVFFAEKSNIVFYPEPLIKLIQKPGAYDDKKMVLKQLDNSFKDYDLEFEKSLEHAKIIYLAQYMQFPSEDIATKPFEELLEESKKRRENYPEDKKLAILEIEKNAIPITNPAFKDIYRRHIFKSIDIVAPLYKFTQASRGTGFAQIVKDMDSTVRLFPIFIFYDNYIYPALTLKMASDILDFNINEIEIKPGKFIQFKNVLIYNDKTHKRRDIIIPIDNNSQTLVNWAGGFNTTFFHYSFKTISYYYAIIKAKEIARKFSPIQENLQTLYLELYNYIEQENLVEPHLISEISASIALSRCFQNEILSAENPQSIKEKIKNDIYLKYVDDVYWSVKISHNLFKELKKNKDIGFINFKQNYKYFCDDEYAKEVFDNIKWFHNKNRIDDVAPFYFPKKQNILINNKLTPVSPLFLENRILMIGLTGIGTIDLNPMPFEESCPMVAMHTNFLNMMLTRQFLRFPPTWYKYFISLFLALITGVITALLSAKIGIIITILISLVYIAIIWFLWTGFGYWLTLVIPLLSIYLSYLSIAVNKYIHSLIDRRKIRNIFSTMVSPAVLKLMEENPDKFTLRGERKPVTTSFSMIQGFNKVTQSVAPDYLSRILSIYLTPTSEIILDYEGYIDKYEGHIIMSDFGVPIDDPNNAWKCAFSSIEQQLDIQAFQYYVYVNYAVSVFTTIGFNWGYVSAGNMGSEKKMQYTVMGDAVNVAARFMPANLIYNSRIITGGETYDKIKNFVEIRKLDKLLLKGKTIPTTIYEVLGWKKDKYIELLGSKPVPNSLLIRWQIAPGTKVFAYYRFMKQKYEETNNPLAKKIKEFFGSQLPLASNITEVGNKIFFLDLIDELNNVCKMYNIDNSVVNNGGDYLELLNNCEGKVVKPIIEELKTDVSRMAELQNIMLLGNKIKMFRNKLELTDDIHELILSSNQHIKEFIQNKNKENIETLNKNLSVIMEKYKKNVADFYDLIKTDNKIYRDMMAEIGAISDNKRDVINIYEDSLEKYWERKWDEALAGFKKCVEIDPVDSPSLCLIDRIKMYKENPPHPNWQGEFVQTKK